MNFPIVTEPAFFTRSAVFCRRSTTIGRRVSGSLQVMRAKTKPPGGFDLGSDIQKGCERRTRFRTGCGFVGEDNVKQFVQFVARCDDFDGRKKAQKSQKNSSVFAHFVPFCGYSLRSHLVAAPPRCEIFG
jgi:hypothetical protein